MSIEPLKTFWNSSNSSNLLLVLVLAVAIIGWMNARGKAQMAEEYAATTKQALHHNNDAALDAMRRQAESNERIKDYRDKVNTDEVNRDFLDTPIPDGL